MVAETTAHGASWELTLSEVPGLPPGVAAPASRGLNRAGVSCRRGGPGTPPRGSQSVEPGLRSAWTTWLHVT